MQYINLLKYLLCNGRKTRAEEFVVFVIGEHTIGRFFNVGLGSGVTRKGFLVTP